MWCLFAAVGWAAPDPLEIEAIAPTWGVAVDTAPLPEGPWWRGLGEPRLAQVVEEGLSANPDLDAARARLSGARGAALAALTPVLPSATFDLGASGQPRDVVFRCNVGPISPDEFSSFGAGTTTEPEGGLCWQGNALFNFRWAVDLFGRSAEGARAAQIEASAVAGTWTRPACGSPAP